MTAIDRALVVGGGISGMAAAIQMRKEGIEVDLIESDALWRPLGAGITLSGPTLRALQVIGVYDAIKKKGFLSDGVELYAANGHLIAQLPTPKPAGADVEGGGGIMRPDLAKILADATLAAGVNVRLGCSYASFRQDSARVEVDFTDGTRGAYDLVVGAEGLHSNLRDALFPDIEQPRYVGQSIWRAVLPRPAEVVRPRMWLSDQHKLGVNPVSATHMYMFLTEHQPAKHHIDEALWPEALADLMKLFPAPFIQSLIGPVGEKGANIDHRSLTNLLMPTPWNRGRIMLIGDTVAATTPHLASGAGIGIESAIVLAEELGRTATIEEAFESFHARRWERCRLVVQNSERLCEIESQGGDKAEHAGLMRSSLIALAAPI